MSQVKNNHLDPYEMSAEDLQHWVVRRLEDGRGPSFLGGDRADEQPEDVIVELLRNLPRADERRNGVIKGLRETGAQIIENLGEEPVEKKSRERLHRWANVIDSAAPPELQGNAQRSDRKRVRRTAYWVHSFSNGRISHSASSGVCRTDSSRICYGNYFGSAGLNAK